MLIQKSVQIKSALDVEFHSFIQVYPDGMIILDEDMYVLAFNQPVADLLELDDASEIRDLADLFEPETAAEIAPVLFSFEDSSETAYPRRGWQQVVCRRRNGQPFWAEITARKKSFSGSECIVVFLQDIDEKKQAEKDLQESERRYRGFLESQTDLIVRVDPAGAFNYVNPAYCAKFGKRPAELLGRSFTPLIHPDDLETTLRAMEGLYRPPHRISVVQRALTTEGWRHISWEDSAILGENGEILEIQAIGRDITESVQSKQWILDQRDLARSLAGTASVREALNLCLDQVIRISGYEFGGVFLPDSRTGDLRMALERGMPKNLAESARVIPAASVLGKRLALGVAVYPPAPAEPNEVDGGVLGAFALIPILFNNQLVACFGLSTQPHREISETGKTAVEEVALQVGNAITRLRAEEDLHSRQKEVQYLFDAMQDYLFVLDEEGRINRVNQRVIDQLGYLPEELIGASFLMLHPPEMRSEAAEVMRKIARGDTSTCTLPLVAKDGRRISVETWISPGHIGGRDYWIGVSRDVSGRLESAQQLEYRSNFEDLLTRISTRFINLPGVEIDAEINLALKEIGEFEQVDRSYVFLLDNERQTMSNTHEWCAPGVEPQIELLQDIPATATSWSLAQLQRHHAIVVDDLADLPAEAASEKEILEAQDIKSLALIPLLMHRLLIGFVGFDIVQNKRAWRSESLAMLQNFANILSNALERQRAETALRQSESRNTALLNAIPDTMFRVRRDGVCLDANVPNVADLKVPLDQLVGHNIFTVLDAETRQRVIESVNNALETGSLQALEYSLQIGKGLQHYEARMVPSGTDEVIAIVRNVSERAHLEQMKSDFINRATHDLRTPLTTVMLMVRLLDGECTPEERQEYWKILKEEMERERDLVEDLLMVGRLESSRWSAKLQPVNPFVVLQQTFRALNMQAQANEISLDLMIEQEERAVLAEGRALERVFNNLLNNAIKFTPIGGKISVRAVSEGGEFSLRIQDNGMGISEEDQKHLFTRFFRGRNATDREVPGSGIGLYIVKSIVEQFKGQVDIKSELGRGTLVTVSLPFAD